MVTHNERVLHAVATKLVVFDRGQVRTFDGTYRDFLDRVGWADEDDGKSSKKGAPSTTEVKQKAEKSAKAKPKVRQSKEGRQRRQAIIEARSKALRPLLKQIQKLEESIVKLEEQAQAANEALEKASAENAVDDIVRLSKEAADAQKQIDEQFEELERVTTDHDWKAQEFERELEELDS